MLKKTYPIFIALALLSHLGNAQVKDSLESDRKTNLAVLIPASAAVAYGFVALNNNTLRQFDSYVHKKINQDNHGFHTTADDYLRYVPALAVYGLDLVGVKGKHNFRDKTTIYAISTVLANASVGILKRSSNRLRPNQLNDYSFPSGHTATAFASAEFLRQEYGDVSVWYSIGGYSIAATTSVLRMYKNYHWFSDVIAGAGFGILSTKFAYMLYPAVERVVFGTKKKKSKMVVLPTYQNGGPALAISGKF